MKFFVSCARGLEPLLADEVTAISGCLAKPTNAGVWFEGDQRAALSVCLWSRVGARVLLPLFECAADADVMYAVATDFKWNAHLADGCTFAIDFSGTNQSIRHTGFGALRLKDAIVDSVNRAGGDAPTLVKTQPQARLSARLAKGRVSVALDLSADPLHRRGYRATQGAAPLRETLAAALLLRAGWPSQHQLLDPMCGSGTLVIEAAMMATDRAPGLSREHWGFFSWPQFSTSDWEQLTADAEARFERGKHVLAKMMVGRDLDARNLDMARDNAERAGLAEYIQWIPADFFQAPAPALDTHQDGLLISNPPYGARLETQGSPDVFYGNLGKQLAAAYQGWQAAVLTPKTVDGRVFGLHSHKQYQIDNGTLPCELLLFQINPDTQLKPRDAQRPSEGAKMVANRIKKNRARLKSWLAKQNIHAYRLYDADLPEYAAALDIYRVIDSSKTLQEYAVLQEYTAPKSIDPGLAKHRLNELTTAVELATGIAKARIVVKTRQRQSGAAQYQAQSADEARNEFYNLHENNTELRVNLYDYLDTGVFLDHRPLRRMIAEQARDADFLNLFCYTAAVSVAAACGGAKSSLSLDMSNTYLDWAKQNYLHNGMNLWAHKLERADCVQWLNTVPKEPAFDLIFLDPPSFSNSKKMEGVLDIQRDHAELIGLAMQLLRPNGKLYFSNNLRRFRMDTDALSAFTLTDLSVESFDPDFVRNQRIHQLWCIQHG